VPSDRVFYFNGQALIVSKIVSIAIVSKSQTKVKPDH
jgi:hypothetical protein